MHRRVGPAATVTLVAALAAACDNGASPVPVATPAARFEDLGASWQSEPFALAPDVVAAADQFCRSNGPPEIPAGFRLHVVDARGGGRLILGFTSDGGGFDGGGFDGGDFDGGGFDRGGFAECQLRTTARGFRGDGGGVQADGPIAIEPSDIAMSAGGGGSGDLPGDDYTDVIGRAGEAVRLVVVSVDDSKLVRASLRDGWFVAWWPFESMRAHIVGYDATGTAIAEARM